MFVPVAASPFRGSTASVSRIAQHQGFHRHALRTHVRWLAAVAHKTKPNKLKTLACNTTIFLRTSCQILILLQYPPKPDITK